MIEGKSIIGALSVTHFILQFEARLSGVSWITLIQAQYTATRLVLTISSHIRIRLQPCANDYVRDVTVKFHTSRNPNGPKGRKHDTCPPVRIRFPSLLHAHAYRKWAHGMELRWHTAHAIPVLWWSFFFCVSGRAHNHRAPLPARYPLPLAPLTRTIPPGPCQSWGVREKQGAVWTQILEKEKS